VQDISFSANSRHPPSTAAVHGESITTTLVSSPRTVTPPPTQPINGKAKPRANLSSDHSPPLVSHVADRWTNQAIIGVKPVSAKTPTEAGSHPAQSDSNSLLGGRTLPGLTTSSSEAYDRLDRSPSTPLTPGRHTRIPSTGNRATIMDVAQAWNEEHGPQESKFAHVQQTDISPDESPEMIEKLAEAIPRPRHITPPNAQAEKRKSSYEKYSAIILPSLPEEKTPAPSPSGTLSQSTAITQLDEVRLIPQPAKTPEVAPLFDADLVHIGEFIAFCIVRAY
jgi:hypothetical protein